MARMAGAIVNMFKVKELRERLFFTLMIVAVYRIGCVLTVPGIDANAVFQYFQEQMNARNNSFASYMDFFVGGAFSHFSIFMLGVMPYISMQIIMQLAVIIFPSLKRISQEDGGQRKIASYIRIGTIFVCIVQALGMTVFADQIPNCQLISNRYLFKTLFILTTLRIFLKYDDDNNPVIHGVKKISTPGRRVYSGYKDLPRVYNGYGTVIVSTSSGVTTGKKATEKMVGGELVCTIW